MTEEAVEEAGGAAVAEAVVEAGGAAEVEVEVEAGAGAAEALIEADMAVALAADASSR